MFSNCGSISIPIAIKFTTIAMATPERPTATRREYESVWLKMVESSNDFKRRFPCNTNNSHNKCCNANQRGYIQPHHNGWQTGDIRH